MTDEPAPDDQTAMARLREELARRAVRRYRRRRFSRWQRRRLLLRLIAVEHDLLEATGARRAFHEAEMHSVVDRLARNAQRLFR